MEVHSLYIGYILIQNLYTGEVIFQNECWIAVMFVWACTVGFQFCVPVMSPWNCVLYADTLSSYMFLSVLFFIQ